jgi:catechol 2,3-dioxygenase-like lactoylglutathione lyase family enzyme
MLDHISINVTDLDHSKSFYLGALAPLDYEIAGEFPGAVGFRNPTSMWEFSLREEKSVTPMHVAFGVSERSLVDAFYSAAIAAGGTDNGGPGLRPHYHENYYAAFVLDPDGNNVEAVCHRAS